MGVQAWLDRADRLDVAVYAAIARADTPRLDASLRRLSDAANYGRLWIGSAAVLAVAGGRRGREAARDGLTALAVTSTVVNAGMKPLWRRRRPERVARGVPIARHVRMPITHSFPSGHAASAFAFATGAGATAPAAAPGLLTFATLVAYSRVHTGVHYPGDVLGGALAGAGLARLTSWVRHRRG